MLHVVIIQDEKTASKIVKEHFGKGVTYVAQFEDGSRQKISNALNSIQDNE